MSCNKPLFSTFQLLLSTSRCFTLHSASIRTLYALVSIHLSLPLTPFSHFCKPQKSQTRKHGKRDMVRAEIGLTLPTHRTEPFRRILLDPRKKAMLCTKIPSISFGISSVPHPFFTPTPQPPLRASKRAGTRATTHHVKRMPTLPHHCPPSRSARVRGSERGMYEKGRNLRSAQSSPGYLHVGHVPSNCTRQMPHTSSSGMSHRQVATADHCFMRTFMASGLYRRERMDDLGGDDDEGWVAWKNGSS